MNLKQIFSKKGFRIFLILYALFFISGAFVLLFIKRGDMVLLINRYSRIEWDYALTILTNIGLGGYLVLAVLLLLFYKLRHAITGLLTLLLIGVFTNVLKGIFKGDYTRPLHYFLYDDFSRFIYTAEVNYFSSFPSGHSMAIFGTMAFFAYIINNRIASIFLFILSVMVGFSRIYLLQHFFVDVYVGAFMGIISVLISVWLAETHFHFLKRSVFDRSVQQNVRVLLFRRLKKTPV